MFTNGGFGMMVSVNALIAMCCRSVFDYYGDYRVFDFVPVRVLRGARLRTDITETGIGRTLNEDERESHCMSFVFGFIANEIECWVQWLNDEQKLALWSFMIEGDDDTRPRIALRLSEKEGVVDIYYFPEERFISMADLVAMYKSLQVGAGPVG